jgi:hypothetical protein
MSSRWRRSTRRDARQLEVVVAGVVVVGLADLGEELGHGVDRDRPLRSQRVLGDEHGERRLAGSARALEPEALAVIEALVDRTAVALDGADDRRVHVLDGVAVEADVEEAAGDVVREAAGAGQGDAAGAALARAGLAGELVEDEAAAVAVGAGELAGGGSHVRGIRTGPCHGEAVSPRTLPKGSRPTLLPGH